MRRLTPQRRIAVICAGIASTSAGSVSLLSNTHLFHASDFARGLFVGVTLGLSIVLIAASLVFIRRDAAKTRDLDTRKLDLR